MRFSLILRWRCSVNARKIIRILILIFLWPLAAAAVLAAEAIMIAMPVSMIFAPDNYFVVWLYVSGFLLVMMTIFFYPMRDLVLADCKKGITDWING